MNALVKLNACSYVTMNIFRQSMKAVITNKIPNGNEEIQQTLKNDNNIFKNIRQSKGIEIREGEQNIDNNKLMNKSKLNTSRPIQTTELRLNKNAMSVRKRPGRPPKAGPSRKQKKESASTMYLGKLSNVVRRRYESESDGDSELS